MTIIAAVSLALTLTACGSEEPADTGSDTSTTTPAGPSTSAAAPSTGGDAGGSADEQWASRFKKAIPPLADTPDAQLVTAGEKMCADFTAAPTPVTAKAIIKEAETTLKLDSVQANMWTGGAIAHFCNDQGTTFLTASVG